jgi:protein-disulfide isomerase
MTPARIHLRLRGVTSAAAAAGAAVAGFAALVSAWSATGALPASLYGRANMFATMTRVQDVPIEFFFCAWFLTVAIAGGRSRRRPAAEMVFTGIFASAIPAAGYALWLSSQRTGWIWPIAGSAAAALVVLLASAAATSVPAANLRGMLDGARDTLRRPVPRAIALAWLAATLLGAQTIRASVRAVSAEAAGERGFATWFDAQSRLPALDASGRRTIQVLIFTDYECPSCQANVPQSEMALQLIQSKSPIPIEVEIRDFPLNHACNAAVPVVLHPAACEAAAAVRFAASRLGAADAHTLGLSFYRAHQRLTQAFVIDQLRERGLDSAFIADHDALLRDIMRATAAAASLGIHATPTVFVNGIRLRSIALLTRAVDRETRRLTAGAGRG